MYDYKKNKIKNIYYIIIDKSLNENFKKKCSYNNDNKTNVKHPNIYIKYFNIEWNNKIIKNILDNIKSTSLQKFTKFCKI